MRASSLVNASYRAFQSLMLLAVYTTPTAPFFFAISFCSSERIAPERSAPKRSALERFALDGSAREQVALLLIERRFRRYRFFASFIQN